MARIEGLPAERAGLLVRLAYWFTRRRFGRMLEPATVLGHHPWILQGAGAYELLLDRARLVDRRLKQLASLKAAARIGCHF